MNPFRTAIPSFQPTCVAARIKEKIGVKVTDPPRGKTEFTIDGCGAEGGREMHSERAFLFARLLFLRPLAERPPVVVALLLQLGPRAEDEGGEGAGTERVSRILSHV